MLGTPSMQAYKGETALRRDFPGTSREGGAIAGLGAHHRAACGMQRRRLGIEVLIRGRDCETARCRKPDCGFPDMRASGREGTIAVGVVSPVNTKGDRYTNS